MDVAVALILREGRVFLQRRSEAARTFPGLWELPGGKVESGESAAQALVRELGEELAWRPAACAPLEPLSHDYGAFGVRLHPFVCDGDEALNPSQNHGWFVPDEALSLPQPEATRRVLLAWMQA